MVNGAYTGLCIILPVHRIIMHKCWKGLWVVQVHNQRHWGPERKSSLPVTQLLTWTTTSIFWFWLQVLFHTSFSGLPTIWVNLAVINAGLIPKTLTHESRCPTTKQTEDFLFAVSSWLCFLPALIHNLKKKQISFLSYYTSNCPAVPSVQVLAPSLTWLFALAPCNFRISLPKPQLWACFRSPLKIFGSTHYLQPPSVALIVLCSGCKHLSAYDLFHNSIL